jgi:putative transposase
MRFIDSEKAAHSVVKLCRHLGVSRAGYYEWKRRQPSRREIEDRRLLVQVEAIHRRKKRRYGSPRMHRELLARGEKVGRARVARLMRENGIRAQRKRPFRMMTTDSNHGLAIAPNLVERDFTAAAPDEVWVGDITYIKTEEGWLFLAVLLDLFSRRIVGYACSATITSTIAERALRNAIKSRRPSPGLIHHTDRGIQYASASYQQLLTENGFVASMSRKGNCLDNAVAESFFSTLKAELVASTTFATRASAARAVRDYIANFYNDERLHSTLGYLSPKRFEELAAAA